MSQSCCNPFDILGHTWSSPRKNLTAWMCERAPHIAIGMKICETCRKKLSKKSPDTTESVTSEPDSPTLPNSQATESDPLFSHSSEAVSSLNVCLAEIGESLFSQSRRPSKAYRGQKVGRLLKLCNKQLLQGHLLMTELR